MKSYKISFLIVGLIFVLLLLTLSPVTAQVNYYVSTTGSDGNTGLAVATAFASIQFAVNTAADGDVINVAPGTYATTTGITIDKSLALRATTYGVIVSGDGSGFGITVTTSGVKITHIALQNLATGIIIDSAVPSGASVQIFGSFIGTTSGVATVGVNNQSPATIKAFGNSWNGGTDPVDGALITGNFVETFPHLLPAPDPAFPFGAEPVNPWGDNTFNGALTALDVANDLKHAVSISTLTGDAFNISDVDRDGDVDETDAVNGLKKVVQSISAFPIETFQLSKATVPFLIEPNFGIDLNREEDEAIVTIGLHEGQKVYSAYLEFIYDEAILQFKEFRRAPDEGSAGSLIQGHGVDGIGRIAAASSKVFGRETQLGRFVFTILDDEKTIDISSEYYRVNGIGGIHSLAVSDAIVPDTYELLNNYPNPFNPETTISFRIPEIADVTIRIYNVLGQEVKRFNITGLSAGIHNVKWRGLNNRNNQVSSGVYFYVMQANGRLIGTKKMLLIK